jgi:methionyl-tRNA synthetase
MARYLVTSALPYANGSIHLGHMVEAVQTDIFVRALRLAGHEAHYLCADDTHGTPIELSARKLGISPEEVIARSYAEHTRDFAGFGIGHDRYYTTNSPENREFAGEIYRRLVAGGHVYKETTTQFFSESLGRFLPDRMVKGTCPYCKTPDQYGDVCESCKRTYKPTDLIDPFDAVEGKTPVLRDTEQIYVRLSDFAPMLAEWTKSGTLQESVLNFVQAWLDGGLESWCISRDAPYFGFEIPGEPGKFFYVWLDAPIGYIATTKKWADETGRDWSQWWREGTDTKLVHVIGKDIIYFHTLFWPAMLKAGGFKTPDQVHVHGFLTVNSRKMSKSRGTFINASTYLEHLDPDYLRFYFAAKLSDGVDDIDLNTDDFITRVNADLVNNVVNLCSRVTKLVARTFGGDVVAFDASRWPVIAAVERGARAANELLLQWDYSGAIRRIAEAGDAANLFIQESEPWKVLKTDPAQAQEICSVALWCASALMTALSPVVPSLAGRYAAAIGVAALGAEQLDPNWRPAKVGAPDILIERIDPARVTALMEAAKALTAPEPTMTETNENVIEIGEFKAPISIDDFSKVDLRVGFIEAAGPVEGADKLLQLTVHCGKRINVFAGVRKAYPDASVLVGRKVIVVANLQPRKMKFGTSEGMLLATSAEDGEGLQLVFVDDSAKGGWTVR